MSLFKSQLSVIIISLLLLVRTPAFATIVCTPTQCLEGNVDIGTTIGAVLKGPSSSILLLPGQYSTSSPQPVTASIGGPIVLPPYLSSSVSTQSSSLPLTIDTLPGASFFPSSFYQGPPAYVSLNITNGTLSTSEQAVPGGSFLLSPRSYAILRGSDSKPFILWDTVFDVNQLPTSALGLQGGSAALLEVESLSCPTPCSSAGKCNAQGICACKPGFTGSMCESCAPGFHGPNCLPCREGCATCDQGITGSGRCLSPIVNNLPSTCGCANGVCDPTGGSCSCKAGWLTSPSNPLNTSSTPLPITKCTECQVGLFKDLNSQCRSCSQTCDACSGPDGRCTQCRSGFSVDSSDPTRCIPSSPSTCTDGTFSNGSGPCTQCSPLCKTCTGPTSSDCIVCGAGRANFNGRCVSFDASGVCSNSGGLVVNNGLGKCDTCPENCSACGIPNFSVVSTFGQVQCTACLPGFVLFEGRCVPQCPRGSFVGADGVSCQTCNRECATCAGTANFCLTCSQSNAFAFQGDCLTTCPPSTFQSVTSSGPNATSADAGGACGACHGDCQSCSGSRFDQCLACPPTRPVLSNGRCLRSCSRNEYFDTTSGGTCKTCSGGCASCVGPSDNQCLSCDPGKGLILQQGKCVPANCFNGANGIAILGGVCLSTLIGAKEEVNSSSSGMPWWKYLLIGSLSIAFVAVCLMLWRWRARKRRAMQTKIFRERIEREGLWSNGFAMGIWGTVAKMWNSPSKDEERTHTDPSRGKLRPFGLTKVDVRDEADLEASQEVEKRSHPVEDWRSRVLTSPIEMVDSKSSSSSRQRRQQRIELSNRDSAFTDASFTTTSSGDGPEDPTRHLPRRSRNGLRSEQTGASTLSMYSQVSSAAASSRRRRSDRRTKDQSLHEVRQPNLPEPRQPLKDGALVSRFSNSTLATGSGLFLQTTGGSSASGHTYPPVLPTQAPSLPTVHVQPLIDIPFNTSGGFAPSQANTGLVPPFQSNNLLTSSSSNGLFLGSSKWMPQQFTGSSSVSAVLSHGTGLTTTSGGASQLGDKNPFRSRLI